MLIPKDGSPFAVEGIDKHERESADNKDSHDERDNEQEALAVHFDQKQLQQDE